MIELGPIRRRHIEGGHVYDVRDDFVKILDGLKPTGQTPLYHAMLTALRSFNENAPGSQHVIVITDGVNDQYRTYDLPVGVATDHQQVIRWLKETGRDEIWLDIIGFNFIIPPDWSAAKKRKWATGRDHLDEIVKRPNVRFYDAQNAGALRKALRDSLRLVTYRVKRVGGSGSSAKSPPLDLGKTWPVDDFQPGEYTIELLGTKPPVRHKVRLDGGEALSLAYNRETNFLEHARYTHALIDEQSNLLDPSNAERRFFVGAHMPDWQGDQVWFTVSIQNQVKRYFSSRPRHVWAEIRPRRGDLVSETEVFYAFDAEYVPETPVPVLRFRVAGWPPGVEAAEMRIWFAPDDSNPTHTLDPIDTRKLVDPLQLEVKTAVRLRIEQRQAAGETPFRVIVDEEHDAASSDYPLALALDPPADYITHAFDNEERTVRHVFTYTSRSMRQQRLRSITPSITTKSDIQEHWISTYPLVVGFPNR